MSKFDKFEPQPRDLWRSTDPSAVVPLIPYIRGLSYAEPCVGEGDLVRLLEPHATCKWSSDIQPQEGSLQKNAVFLTKEDVKDCDVITTNPPFSWSMLQPLCDHLPTLKPTWLLLPADSMHNKYFRPYMDKCSLVLSIGRLFFHKAEESLDVKYAKGTANMCWYRLEDYECDTIYKGWVRKGALL